MTEDKAVINKQVWNGRSSYIPTTIRRKCKSKGIWI